MGLPVQVLKAMHDDALLEIRLKHVRLELSNLQASDVFHHTLAPSLRANLDRCLAEVESEGAWDPALRRARCLFRHGHGVGRVMDGLGYVYLLWMQR